LIDIATRAASALGLEVERYIDAGYKLKSVNIINDSELKLYRKVVGFGNIVVHEYSLIKPETVKEIIQKCLAASGVSRVFKSSFNILYSELFVEAFVYGY